MTSVVTVCPKLCLILMIKGLMCEHKTPTLNQNKETKNKYINRSKTQGCYYKHLIATVDFKKLQITHRCKY